MPRDKKKSDKPQQPQKGPKRLGRKNRLARYKAGATREVNQAKRLWRHLLRRRRKFERLIATKPTHRSFASRVRRARRWRRDEVAAARLQALDRSGLILPRHIRVSQLGIS